MHRASGGDDRHARALDVLVDGRGSAPSGAGLAVEEAREGDVGAAVVRDGVFGLVRDEGFFVRAAAFALSGVDAGGDDGVSGVWELGEEGESDVDLVAE